MSWELEKLKKNSEMNKHEPSRGFLKNPRIFEEDLSGKAVKYHNTNFTEYRGQRNIKFGLFALSSYLHLAFYLKQNSYKALNRHRGYWFVGF